MKYTLQLGSEGERTVEADGYKVDEPFVTFVRNVAGTMVPVASYPVARVIEIRAEGAEKA
jgi:hypothetical protein